MNKAAIFIRVSTEEQDTENQRLKLMELINRRNYEHVKTYDVTQSVYHHASTEYLSELREDARLGKYNILCVWSLDRLSRRGIMHTLNIVNELCNNGVKIVSLQDGFIDTLTDNNIRDLFIAFISFIARYESQRKSANIKAGLAKKKQLGYNIGKPKGAKDIKTRRKIGYLGNQNAKSKV